MGSRAFEPRWCLRLHCRRKREDGEGGQEQGQRMRGRGGRGRGGRVGGRGGGYVQAGGVQLQAHMAAGGMAHMRMG